MSDLQPPTRDEVERRWRAVIAGEMSREEIHSWVRPWVEESVPEGRVEWIVEGVLTTLHGFDMTHPAGNRRLIRHGDHGEHRPYYHPMSYIKDELEAWLQQLQAYDEDPVAYRAESRRRIEANHDRNRRNFHHQRVRRLSKRARERVWVLPGDEVMWPRYWARHAVSEITGQGGVILGLDLRSDRWDGADPIVPVEIPWASFEVTTPEKSLEWAIEALADLTDDLHRDHGWVLVTWEWPNTADGEPDLR
ncbi:MAG: hypothetical protein RIE08_13530 [Acidimicrobiales bacterium]